MALGNMLQPPYPDPERNARAALTKAATGSNPEHRIADALVGIGWAVLHLASTQRKGANHGQDAER